MEKQALIALFTSTSLGKKCTNGFLSRLNLFFDGSRKATLGIIQFWFGTKEEILSNGP